MSIESEQIVITGMGAVSSLGLDVPSMWAGLLEGRCGIGPLTKLDAEKHRTKHAGEVRGLATMPLGNPIDPAVRFVLHAGSEALANAEVDNDGRENIALVLGTNFGAMSATEEILSGENIMEPELAFAGGATQFAARALGLGGIISTISLSCASGNAAIGYAADLIAQGAADIVLAGAYDAISENVWAGLCSLRAMTKDTIRPFDKRRNGTIFSEGAGMLLLESASHAQKRGATSLAKFLGYATTSDAHHMTHPQPEGAGTAETMRQALAAAKILPENVDHINAHATGTKYNDKLETLAIKSVFGEHANKIPINGIKSMLGHSMGAASALEAIASIMTIRESIIPPTIGLEEPDDECDLDYVPLKARQADVNIVLNNAAGFGGCNACVVLGKVEVD